MHENIHDVITVGLNNTRDTQAIGPELIQNGSVCESHSFRIFSILYVLCINSCVFWLFFFFLLAKRKRVIRRKKLRIFIIFALP